MSMSRGRTVNSRAATQNGAQGGSRLPSSASATAELSVGSAQRDALLTPNQIYHGDARDLLKSIETNSIPLSIWSPPYFVGKSYEQHLSYEEWKSLIGEVIHLHYPIIRPGGFVAINIADILCFRDSNMPRLQADSVDRKRSPVTREDILHAMKQFPHLKRHELARLLGCSEQTIDRRLKGNNARGGKYAAQTRVHLVGGLVEEWCRQSGFYLYDRRIWIKDPAWENNPWFTLSYRSIDEFEYIYILWKPGVTQVRRSRLSSQEWSEWGARAVWQFPSVRKNEAHESQFPVELPRRLIKLLSEPGEVVLDCFVGSGTTAIAALMEGRQFIGIELMPEYVQLARERIEHFRATQQHTLCF